MIRFVDLRKAMIAGGRFAFFDTVIDRFVEDNFGDQVWETIDEFLEGNQNREISRFIRLTPEWTKRPADVEKGSVK